MATSLSKNEALVILSVKKVPSDKKSPPGFAAGRFIKFGRASPPMVPHTGHKILSKILLVSACGEGRFTGSPFCWLLQC
jgi:hypothetical protein